MTNNMVRESSLGMMEKNIQGNLRMGAEKAKENMNIKVEQFMWVNLKIVRNMEKEF